MKTQILAGALALSIGLAPAAAFAQASPPSAATSAGTTQSERPGCVPPDNTAATPPTQGANSGTQPGNAGSTGWSGGTGGSNIGTSPHASTSDENKQPEVVTGLDPKVGPTRSQC